MTDPPTQAPQQTPKEKAEILLRAALSKKAEDPVLMRLSDLTALTDYFLVLSGRSERHVQAVSEAIVKAAKEAKVARFSREGLREGKWALLDYGDVVVHVFQKPVREFYDLEGLWMEAPREEFSEAIVREIEAARTAVDEEDEWEEYYDEPY